MLKVRHRFNVINVIFISVTNAMMQNIRAAAIPVHYNIAMVRFNLRVRRVMKIGQESFGK
ncbi:hypothetical protein [Paenibacillus guangzhouensis]|uniref:hypothetical protein n=1 Tax=Paenibacillus guangzhouensis TaxID=1473112 RepID=UPI00126691EA|nr:hypothetical protein [Paenibacillus guangzhouensis]